MDRRSLPLNALRTFESAARHLNFSRAGDELGVTHGAVSRQISILESMLDLRLFVRNHPIQLTEEGRRLFEGVAPSFDRLTATMNSLNKNDQSQTLFVNAPPTFTMKWLIPRLSGFQVKHNKAEIRLTTSTKDVGSLMMSDYDLVIRRLQAPLSDPEPRPFLSGTLVAVCSPDLLETQPVRSVADISKHCLIEAATNTHSWDDWFHKAGIERQGAGRVQRFEEMFYALQAAHDGLGIALVPSTLVVDDLAAARLVIPPHMPVVEDRDYCYVLAPVVRNLRLTQAFCAWLTEQGTASDQLSSEVLDQARRTTQRASSPHIVSS